jgi:glycosyltransferase involved in cell wall biosynthesis
MTFSVSTLSNMACDPLVTIAIPTFNRASLLRSCVAAALAQSYQHFEVLVSNNASTDETAEVLECFDDLRLRVVKQERNIGLIPNWNACLAEAKGEYIVFVSDDDLVAPWLLDRCIDVVRSEPDVPIVIALSDISFPSGYKLPARVNRKLGTGVWDGTDVLREVLDDSVSASMCTIMIRTEALRANGGFPVNWGPHTVDKAAWVPFLLTSRAGLVNERCGTYTTHDGSVTSNLTIDMILRDVRKVVDLITDVADHSIGDLKKRHQVKQLAKRYFALCTINLLGSRRRGGYTLAEAIPEIWRWRRELAYIRLSDFSALAKPIAFLLLPAPIVRWVRYAVASSKSLRSGGVR